MTETIEQNGLSNLPEGVTVERLQDIVSQFRGNIREQAATVEAKVAAITDAQVRLEKLRLQSGPVVVTFDYEGETFYVKRLNYNDLIELALSVTRDGYNVLSISDEGGVRSVTIAVLSCCVCDEQGERYFSREEVEQYLDEPAASALVSALFAKCNQINPDIFGTLKKT
jgi:hypothetical protein